MDIDQDVAEPTSEAVAKRYDVIERALEEIRPRLQADGGDCQLVSVEGKVVTVRLTGACVGCVLSGATINGVQALLMEKLGFPIRVALANPGPSRPVQMTSRPVQIRRPN